MLAFAPRALLRRPLLTIEISPAELYLLIQSLERVAIQAADAGLDLAADVYFQRVAELRELGR